MEIEKMIFDPPGSRNTSHTAVWFFAFLTSVYLLFGGGHMYSADNNAKLGVAIQLVKTGWVAMAEDWDGGYTFIGADGRTYIPFPIGSTLVYVPCVLAAELLARVFPSIPARYVTEFLVVSTNAFISAALCVVLFLAASTLGYSKRAALLTSLVAGLATIVWPYAKQEWSEPPAALAVAVAAYSLVCYRLNPRRRYAVGAGLALGAASLFRLETMALFPVGIGLLVYAWRKADRSHPFPQVALGFSLAYFLAWAPNPWYNQARTGNPLNFVYGDFMQRKELVHQLHDETSPNLSSQEAHVTLPNLWIQRALSVPKRLPLTIARILVSPGKSVLFFSPPLLLLPWAWPRFRRQQPQTFWFWMGLPLAYGAVLCLYGAGSSWAWGERYWMPIVPLLVLPGVALLAGSNESLPQVCRAPIVLLLMAGVIVQWLGVATNYQVTYEKLLARGHPMDWQAESPAMIWNPANSLLWLSANEFSALARGSLWLGRLRYSGKDLAHLDPKRVASPLGLPLNKPADVIRFHTFDFWWLYAYFSGFPVPVVAFGWALLGGTAVLSGWRLHRSVAT